jgi:hypothetical protein
MIGAFPAPLRRAVVGALLVFAAGVVILSAEPFADGFLLSSKINQWTLLVGRSACSRA